jgi:hypothetical protein
MTKLSMQSKRNEATAVSMQRLERMAAELAVAISGTDRFALHEWGIGTGKDFAQSLRRRVKNTSRTVMAIGRWTGTELLEAGRAYCEKRLGRHLSRRGKEVIETGGAFVSDTKLSISHTLDALRKSPEEAGPQLFVMVLSALVVSGGADGDGGAPDLDLIFGIGAHRSFLSHSIVMGAALETGVLAIVRLTQIVHRNLPYGYDPVWDKIIFHAETLLGASKAGASIGMSYHLLVDGLIQPAAYKDLPFSMPLEAHQGLIVANSAVELADIKARRLAPIHSAAPDDGQPAMPLHANTFDSYDDATMFARIQSRKVGKSLKVAREGGRWLVLT